LVDGQAEHDHDHDHDHDHAGVVAPGDGPEAATGGAAG
jgi:hypothetical protein